jgi:hypothetical protein
VTQKTQKYYIQFKYENCPLETVDEFDTLKEAKLMLREYQMSSGGTYRISTRACKAWLER